MVVMSGCGSLLVKNIITAHLRRLLMVAVASGGAKSTIRATKSGCLTTIRGCRSITCCTTVKFERAMVASDGRVARIDKGTVAYTVIR